MKIIAIHLAMAWIVLQATPPSVRGGSLRGLSSLGGDAVIKRARTSLTDATAASVPQAVSPNGCKTKPKNNAEVYYGRHAAGKEFEQAKIFVISSNQNLLTHPLLKDYWKDIANADLPDGYSGDTDDGCTKYFTIGAGPSDTDDDMLLAKINRESDEVGNGFEHAVFVKNINYEFLPTFFENYIKTPIAVVNSNFAVQNSNGKTKTILKYESYLKKDWYKLGYDWVEFNANSFVSGLLKHWGIRPNRLPGYGLHGWDKSIPPTFFYTRYTTIEDMKKAVYSTQKCEGAGSNAELWVGYHPILSDEQNVLIDHAKLWVISSNPSHFNLPNVVWHDLRREMVPSDYQGNRDCAKFFTIGSGFAQGELKGELNNEDDREEPLWGAKKVDSNCNPVSLWEKIQSSNVILGKNYAKGLQRSTDFPEEFNDWGFKWNEFSGNGYISGFLNYYTNLVTAQDTFKPMGANLIGWDKDVNMRYFSNEFASNKAVEEEFFREHRPKNYTPAPVTADETQSLDPNLSSPPLGPTSEATELAPELELAPDLDPASENPVQLEPTDDPLFRAKQL